MAIGQGDGSIILNTKVDTNGLKQGFSSIEQGAKKMSATVGKAFAAIAAAATAAVVSIVKASVDAYAEYEQLVGGVETLFKGSSKKVLEYASESFRTTGLSANEYMANVTSFSASLLSSLGGDTEKAADVANAALISMSDNANKMGSSMESIQMAFQGFAKGQYMLLDNLKLGYGGTKTEMERLLKDAQAITGVKYDIDNLADVYTAIGVIQEKLGIAGTTAKEAATTISGSAAMTKAAWKDVLAAISGGGDLDRAIDNLVDSISLYFENIVPVVERALSGIGTLVEKIAPQLVKTVAKSLIKAIPSLLKAVYEMIIGLAKGIYEGIVELFNETSTEALQEQADTIEKSVENQNALTDAVEETNDAAKKTLAGFDDIEILSASISEEMSQEPIAPQVSGEALAESVEVEKTEKQASKLGGVLELIFGKISKIIKEAWSSEPVQAFWGAVKSFGKTGLKGLKTLGESLQKNLKRTWKNISGDFGTASSNMVNLWTKFWQDVQIGVDTWGAPLFEKINTLFNDIWTTAFDPYVQNMAKAWSDFTGILSSKWSEYGTPLMQNIGEFANNVVSFFQSIYDNVLEPIITPFLQELSSLWNNHISGLVDRFVEFVMKVVNGAVEIYNKFIRPIANWLMKVLAPAWSYIGKLISGVFGTIIGTIADVAGGLFKYLGGVIDFIVGVFTGDWKRAWEGVKSIFKGIFEALVGIVKAPINLIIDFINAFIAGLNKVQFDLPNWDVLGDWAGKKFGLNIPKIPKLAQGAVIPPNREFLAVLGDQKQGMNIETPLSTMVEAFQMALDSRGGYNGRNIEVVLELDGREFGRAVVEQGNRENRRIGTRLVVV